MTTSKKKEPAGHGGGSIEKSDRKFRRGDATKLNKTNGESPNSHPVSTSLDRPATRKNREILNELEFELASDDCKKCQESLCLQLYELSTGNYALTDPKGGQRTSENAIVRERGVSCRAKPSAC